MLGLKVCSTSAWLIRHRDKVKWYQRTDRQTDRHIYRDRDIHTYQQRDTDTERDTYHTHTHTQTHLHSI